jgi:ion channel-forming bestrophin family protein
MITKTDMSWVRMLFTIRGTSLRDSWPRIIVATLIAGLVTVVELRWGLEKYTLTPAPFTIIGVAISIFLGFRNNTAYNRFWEGRILWGNMVNTSRSFARQIHTLITVPGTDKEELRELTAFKNRLIYQAMAFVHTLRHHLRDSSPQPELERLLPAKDVLFVNSYQNKPFAILQLMGIQLVYARQKQWLESYHVAILEESLTTMTAILGACERIKNTPIPFPYTILSHRIVAFFCFFLPFGIVDSVGAFTPFVVFLVSHAFFGLDVIGEEVENPFGTGPHHLPLTALSLTIEINLRQTLGEENVPVPLAPTNGVLL